MASLGEALQALDEFRADLVQLQSGAGGTPTAQAMAFRGGATRAAGAAAGPAHGLHATGVGIRAGVVDDFVIKVYVFDSLAQQAAQSEALLSATRQGVAVDVQVLPQQQAYAAANPAQHRARRRPVPGGVEIGPLAGAYVGTLGCFVRRGPDTSGPLFVLSNNHVLSDVDRLPPGTRLTQPFSAASSDVIATLSESEPIQFPTAHAQPRNVIDAAIAAVTDTTQVVTGRMLNIKRYVPQLLAARPGMAVTKSGRTTGVTAGVIQAIRVRGVQVNYGSQGNPIIATFDNAITVAGNGGPFSNPGDSGSVILDKASGRPVALLFAGDGQTSTACDMAAVCARFNVRPV